MHVGKEVKSSGEVRLGFLHGGSVYVFARLENEVFDHCVGQSFSGGLCQFAGQCPNCLLPVLSASLDDYGCATTTQVREGAGMSQTVLL